jgi:hypothetical protein
MEGRVDRVLVVSPHLDDAGLSLGDQLRHLPADVLTVFSHADETTDVTWAHTCGFRDAFAEYEARRAEDKAAMAAIGIPYAYAGLAYGDLTDAAAARMLDALQARIADVPCLTLLPLGAGGVSGGFDRLWRRVLRRPFGSPQHPDHVWVRDHLRAALKGPIGYYAEIPYHWSNSQTALARMARDLIPGQMGRVTHGVDVDFKHETSCLYASQVAVELGADPAYQRKVCAADEIVFLPL